jgi:hypothetical protein
MFEGGSKMLDSSQVSPVIPDSVSQAATLCCIKHDRLPQQATNSAEVFCCNLLQFVMLEVDIFQQVCRWQGAVLLQIADNSDQIIQQLCPLSLHALSFACVRQVLTGPSAYH